MVNKSRLVLQEWYRNYKKKLELQRIRYKTKTKLWMLKLSEINIAPLFVFLLLLLFYPNRNFFVLFLASFGLYYTYKILYEDIYKPWLTAYERKR
jgi:hypothetical protein